MNDEITSPDGTTPARMRVLIGQNSRLRQFVVRAVERGWTYEPSTVAPDTIVVRHPSSLDHFVLYPHGSRRTASLAVYDGRDGYEFSPLPARDALSFISQNRVSG